MAASSFPIKARAPQPAPDQDAIVLPRAALAASAGTLIASPARAGVDANEIVSIAVAAASAGVKWASDGCAAFAWGVSNLAGLPFFDLTNRTANNSPLTPQDTSYVVPHAWNSNASGDGWDLASTDRSVTGLAKVLRAGDIVRVYAAGNSTEATFLNGKAAGHSFIVVSNKNGDVQVVDNWSGGKISQHSLSVISKSFAPGGTFGSVYVSRVNDSWVDSNVNEASIKGKGYGDWSAFADTTAPTLVNSSPADGAPKVAVDANIVLKFNEAVTDGSGNIEIWAKGGKKPFETIDIDSSRVTFSGPTVTIDPKGKLAAGTDYYVIIPKGVIEDEAGNDFAGFTKATDLNFTTAVPDTTAPKLVSSTPSDGAPKVAVDANIVLKFNEAVTDGSGNIEIWAKGGKKPFETIDIDSSRVTFSGSTVTIDPKGKLAAGTDYYVIIPKGAIEDEAGNDFAGFTKTTDLNFATAGKSANIRSADLAHPSTAQGNEDGNSPLQSILSDEPEVILGELSFSKVSMSAFADGGSVVMEWREITVSLHIYPGWDLP